MKLSDFFKDYKAHAEKTDLALAAANETISKLSGKLAAFENTSKAKADADADEDSKIDDLLEQLRQALNDQAASDDKDDATDSDTDTDSDEDTDSAPDDSSDDDEAKASKSEKLKEIALATSKLVAKSKAVKASIPKEVIKQIAAVGIPTPIATQTENKGATNLKGIDRVAASFKSQLSK